MSSAESSLVELKTALEEAKTRLPQQEEVWRESASILHRDPKSLKEIEGWRTRFKDSIAKLEDAIKKLEDDIAHAPAPKEKEKVDGGRKTKKTRKSKKSKKAKKTRKH